MKCSNCGTEYDQKHYRWRGRGEAAHHCCFEFALGKKWFAVVDDNAPDYHETFPPSISATIDNVVTPFDDPTEEIEADVIYGDPDPSEGGELEPDFEQPNPIDIPEYSTIAINAMTDEEFKSYQELIGAKANVLFEKSEALHKQARESHGLTQECFECGGAGFPSLWSVFDDCIKCDGTGKESVSDKLHEEADAITACAMRLVERIKANRRNRLQVGSKILFRQLSTSLCNVTSVWRHEHGAVWGLVISCDDFEMIATDAELKYIDAGVL